MADASWIQEYFQSNQDNPNLLTASVVVALNRQIFERMAELEISQKELAIKAGFPPAYLNRQLNHGRNLTIKTLVRIAHALDLRLEQQLLRPKEVRKSANREFCDSAQQRNLGHRSSVPQALRSFTNRQLNCLTSPFQFKPYLFKPCLQKDRVTDGSCV
jgi:transcriptional regulator with XRE-family HTH domain